MLLRHATSSIAQWLAALGPAATKSLRRLRRDRRGSVAILFALAAVMVFTAVGAAVDYSHITKTRSEMLNACDAGLLAAMRQLQLDGPPAASTGGGTLPGTGTTTGTGTGTATGTGTTAAANTLSGSAVQPYKDLATNVFKGNLRDDAASTGPSFSLTLTQADGQIKGVGHFDANVPLYFGGFLGMTTAAVSNECQSQVGNVPRMDFHFLVDTSMSMGLAATVDGRNTMRLGTAADPRLADVDRARFDDGGVTTYRGCSFGCHQGRANFDGSYPANQITTLQWAHDNHIRLRIDVAKEGVKTFIDYAEANKNGAQFRYGLNTFNQEYRKVKEPPDTASTAKSWADNLVLGYPNIVPPDGGNPTWPDSATGFSKFAADLKDYMATTPAAGYKQFIVLVTDGVRSTPAMNFASGQLHEFYAEYCDTLKATGAQVGVLYTQYLEDSGEPFFESDVRKFYPKIAPALEACASKPSLFVQADTPDDIIKGFKTLFDQAKNELYLSR